MFKLALDAGHDLNNAKCCIKSIDPNQTKEWWLNDRICDKIQKLFSEYDGIEIMRTDDTTGKKYINVSDRAKAANKFDADFFLSIHHNGGVKGGKGGGVVAYTYTKVDDTTKAWQKELYNAIVGATGLKGNRAKPLATASYAVLRETKMPAVLMECGFMDSATDTPIILTEAFADKVAKACVDVIVKRAGLKEKEQPKPVPAPVPTPAPAPTPAPTPKPTPAPAPVKKTYKAGDTVVLNKTPLYASATSKIKVGTKTGTYWVYDGIAKNGRYRITNKASRVGKTPAGLNVTGWVVL